MADFDFMDINAADIVESVVTRTEARIGEPLYPGDERRLFCEALSAELIQVFSEINDACKQRFLRYARNSALDALGERMMTTRLEPTPARCILRFSVAEARDRSTFIPQGTRATADGKIHFSTQSAASIPAGETHVDVSAVCTTGGEAYNGYGVGAISTITDMIPYVAGVTNLDETHGGDDGEPADDGGEGDERYRERIRLSPAKLSTAGPEASYIYHAKSASPLITDVRPLNDHDAGTVELVIVTGEEDPSEDVIKAVLEAVNDEKVRPLNDRVNVTGPERVSFDIELKYYVTADNEAAAIETLEGTGGALEQFVAWQMGKVGRDINPDRLRAFCLAPKTGTGALRIDVVKPIYTKMTERQLAKFSGVLKVTHEVAEE